MNAQSDILAANNSSLIRRLWYTPLSDLLRGRLTARLDVESLIERAALAVPLPALVRGIVRRSRLWDGEKAAVAEELIAHFADALAGGRGPAEVAQSFGDAAVAARLIRRAKRRSRPLPIQAMTWAIRGAGCLMLFCAAAYVFFAVRMYTGEIVIRRNYVAEYNAPILAMKEEDKAWPLYKRAFLASGAPPQGMRSDSINPENEHWPKWEEYEAANHEAIRLYRFGASRPRCGKPLSDATDSEEIAHRKERGESTEFYTTRPAS